VFWDPKIVDYHPKKKETCLCGGISNRKRKKKEVVEVWEES